MTSPPQFECDVNLWTNANSGYRTSPPRLGVFHTTENSDTTDAEAVARWQQNRSNESSYNVLFGTGGKSVRSNDDNIVPWSAMWSGNHAGLHGSAIGRASRSREDWLKFPKQMEVMAEWAADVHKRHGIPLIWRDAAEVAAGKWGFCGHKEISDAFKESTHTDPGPGFPHDVVLARAQEIAYPLKDETGSDAVGKDEQRSLILDQLVGHPWEEWPGWPQLGGMSLVDAVATIGAVVGIDGFKDMRDPRNMTGGK